MNNTTETIAALATPIGIGGIAVIRITGDQSIQIADFLFRGSIKLREARSHTVHFGKITEQDTNTEIDSVLVTVFRGPHSYTGGDTVEISAHGGYYVSQKILDAVYKAGASPARPGEFTLRAFLNGKLDLSQAEAVSDIIHSRTEKSHHASIEQLSGKLSSYINELRTKLLDLCSLLELELDFSQEGIELTQKNESLKRIKDIESKIQSMIDSYSTGKLTKEGVKVALAGRPNAGKSSLLNILLEEDRAIVSEIPGTTRDVIEESISIGGVEFIFIDTAGLRESTDIIEKEGIRRTVQKLQKADIALFVIDSSQPLTSADVTMYQEIIGSLRSDVHALFAINKVDIRNELFDSDTLPKGEKIKISCLKHSGIDKLKNILLKTSIPDYDSLSSSVIITSARHKDALAKAIESLQNAKISLINGMSGEFIAVDLRDALNYLGEIIGLTTPDDILNNIFSQFCIGK
ncbi:MAG: tRNA uridine-5-carboxymethylaminomethyl(34) synthesis GTPase MnmE [Ignavibacteriales bacterium]|nr:tRNA uridine-5-carboxymethylaminomethyl(34) synthesis GTPase MnmE [Ignavibacteriales bacterium]